MNNGHNGVNGYRSHDGLNGISWDHRADSGDQPTLIPYLASLGFTDAELAKVNELLGADGSPAPGQLIKEEAVSEDMAKAGQREPRPEKATIGLFLVEEQHILKDAYRSFFSEHQSIKLLGTSSETSSGFLLKQARSLNPDVLFLGINVLRTATMQNVQSVREAHPELGLILLFSSYDTQGIQEIRKISMGGPGGSAYLPKHTIDTMDQLSELIYAVAQGRIIVDPVVMDGLINTEDSKREPLGRISPRDLEGLRVLIQRDRNYGKGPLESTGHKGITWFLDMLRGLVGNSDEALDPRTGAALIYLFETGLFNSAQRSDQ
ncbi:MAG: response regulator transcription factor [Chloroflexi bacterium]|nr:response regulator transcription factor [Chloroflexota bacterium]